MDGEAEGLLEEDDGALDDGGVRLGLATQQSEEREKGEDVENAEVMQLELTIRKTIFQF